MPRISSSDFSRLFSENKDRLVALANSYVHDIHVAEDIVADTFTKFWDRGGAADTFGGFPVSIGSAALPLRKAQPLQPAASPKMYLYSMVRNRCLNYLRDRATHQRILDERLRIDIETLENEVSETMAGGEMERELSRYLEGLPRACREIFCASRFDGLSHDEIAAKYGYSARKIRREIGKVLEELRKIFCTR